MKRKVIFLQYILKQEKMSMIYQVFKATLENPTKKDFIQICMQYLDALDIKMSFEEIEKMSERKFKNFVKIKTEEAALIYLEKEKQKQTKIANMKHLKLEMQDYFVDGNCTKKIAILIFKARSQTLDIKMQRKWMYADKICIGCQKTEESGDEIMICENLNNENRTADIPVRYDWFFGENINDLVKAGKIIYNGLKERKKILETGIT